MLRKVFFWRQPIILWVCRSVAMIFTPAKVGQKMPALTNIADYGFMEGTDGKFLIALIS